MVDPDVSFELLLEDLNGEAQYMRHHPHDAGAVEDVHRATAALVEYVKSFPSFPATRLETVDGQPIRYEGFHEVRQ